MSKLGFEATDDQDWEENRRNHFFRGLNKLEYHKYFDTMYHLHQGKLKRKEMHMLEQDDSVRVRAKYTLRQDTVCFKIWNILKLIVCLVTTLQYPYYSVNGFPEIYTSQFWQLMMLEAVFGLDILLRFFLQELDEDGKQQDLPLEEVASNYLKNQFVIDLIAIIPFGAIFSSFDERLAFLWLIKAIRITDLKFYMSDRFFKPLIIFCIETK